MSALSQQVTTRQQWTDAKVWETQDTKTQMITVKIFYWFHGAKLTLDSDVDQDLFSRLEAQIIILKSRDMWFPTMWYFDKCRLRRAFAASF